MSKDKEKKQQIISKLMEYNDNGVVNVSEFRKTNPKLYATLSYYFGGINNLLDELGLTKVQKSKQKNKMTLRNKLAYDMLVELRKTNTLEQIASKYDVSRALVNQLYQALDLSVKIEDVKQELEG